jgi:hypothetical protein
VVLLLVLQDEGASLRFLIRTDWQKIVQKDDLGYIEALLQDFVLRAEQDPVALYKQISSLGVGPLVTREVGSSHSSCFPIRALQSHFIQFGAGSGGSIKNSIRG